MAHARSAPRPGSGPFPLSTEPSSRAFDHDDSHYSHSPRTISPAHNANSPALSTPHDAALAEIHGAAYASPASPPPWHPLSPSAGTFESAISSPQAPELVYDPATGAAVGAFEGARDELWASLGAIRELQSEIAGMHVQMEGTGLAARGRAVRAASVAPGDGEEWEEAEGRGAAEKRARDAEFKDLAQAFEGRRAGIDGIMNKLGELSAALTTFHALPTPVMEFSTSRNNTKDTAASAPVSPDPNQPASSAVSAANSPTPELPRLLISHVEGKPAAVSDSPVSFSADLLPNLSRK